MTSAVSRVLQLKSSFQLLSISPMTDYLDITDTLIMLLSSDWFLPFWNEIGIDSADGTKIAIQEGCRTIVRRFMEDSGSYLHIDFREERWQDTNSAFIELLDSFGAAKLVAALITADAEVIPFWGYFRIAHHSTAMHAASNLVTCELCKRLVFVSSRFSCYWRAVTLIPSIADKSHRAIGS